MKPWTLQDLLSSFRASFAADLHTAMPGKVSKYDASTQKADVKPLLQSRWVDESDKQQTSEYPVIPCVPVVFPGAGKYRLTFPITTETTGMLFFCEASLDKWLISGGMVDPASDRRHDLTDAVFIPGLRDFGHALKSAPIDRLTLGDDEGLQIHIDGSSIRIGSNTPVELESAALGDTIYTFLQNLLVYATSHTHPYTGGTTSPPSPAPPPPSLSDTRSSSVKVKK